jgi:hypothetical protein
MRSARIKFTAVVVVVVVGLILTLARLDNRSTPGRIVRRLQGESLIEQYSNDFPEDAKKAVDPSGLQRWAVTVLQETQQSERPEVREDEISPSLRNLRSNGLAYEMIMCDSEDSASPHERSVCILWGGGFGHWGIRVGGPTFKVVPASAYNAYVEWRPGIYFLRELQ